MYSGPLNSEIVLSVRRHPALLPRAFGVNTFLQHALGDAISPSVIGALSDSFSSLRAAFFLIPLFFGLSMCAFLIGWVFASPAPLLVYDPVADAAQNPDAVVSDIDTQTVHSINPHHATAAASNPKITITKKSRSSRGDGLIIFHGDEGGDVVPPTPSTLNGNNNGPILLNIIGAPTDATATTDTVMVVKVDSEELEDVDGTSYKSLDSRNDSEVSAAGGVGSFDVIIPRTPQNNNSSSLNNSEAELLSSSFSSSASSTPLFSSSAAHRLNINSGGGGGGRRRSLNITPLSLDSPVSSSSSGVFVIPESSSSSDGVK